MKTFIEKHLENGTMEEQGKQLDKVVKDITIFFLDTNDVGGVIRLILAHRDMVEGEKAELEEVFDHDSHLEKKNHIQSVQALQ